MVMRNIIKIIFTLSLLIPINLYADISAGVFRFQEKLAEQGNPEAQYKVGEMYEMGKGVRKNLDIAHTWFEKSAAQNHQKAVYKLLYIEIKTNGLNNTTKTQLGILRQEAASGNPDAQYFLGKMYATGIGVPKSLDNALTWLNKATFNGVSEAEHEAITVEEKIARNKEIESRKRQQAIANSKKKKAEDESAKIQKRKQAEKNKIAEEARRKARRDAEAKRTANERKRLNEERAELAREKTRLQQQRAAAQQEAAAIKAASEEKESAESDGPVTFDSDPCKGKKAKFLSTCR